MTILDFNILLHPISKPRGKQLKNGIINHSQVRDRYGIKYEDWKDSFQYQLKQYWKWNTTVKLQGLIIYFYVDNQRNDIDNLSGSVLDAAQKVLIQSDNLAHVPRCYLDHELIDSNEEPEKIKIVCIYNERDWQQVLHQEIGKILVSKNA